MREKIKINKKNKKIKIKINNFQIHGVSHVIKLFLHNLCTTNQGTLKTLQGSRYFY